MYSLYYRLSIYRVLLFPLFRTKRVKQLREIYLRRSSIAGHTKFPLPIVPSNLRLLTSSSKQRRSYRICRIPSGIARRQTGEPEQLFTAFRLHWLRSKNAAKIKNLLKNISRPKSVRSVTRKTSKARTNSCIAWFFKTHDFAMRSTFSLVRRQRRYFAPKDPFRHLSARHRSATPLSSIVKITDITFWTNLVRLMTAWASPTRVFTL